MTDRKPNQCRGEDDVELVPLDEPGEGDVGVRRDLGDRLFTSIFSHSAIHSSGDTIVGVIIFTSDIWLYSLSPSFDTLFEHGFVRYRDFL